MDILFTCLLISLLFGQLGALTISPGVTIYIHDVVLLIFLLSGVIVRVRSKKRYPLPVLFMPIVGFISAAIISLLFNVNKFSFPQLVEASLYLLRFSLYAGVYAVVSQGVIKHDSVLKKLYILGVGFSVIGFVQYIWYPELRNLSYAGWDPHYLRLFTTLFDPNYTGLLIVCTLLLGVYLWQKKYVSWLIPTEIMCLVALYLTFSRSSYLAFLLASTTYLILKKQWKIFLIIILFVGAIIIIPKPGGHTLLLTRTPSTLARIGNWKESLGIIARAPFFGHGFNTLRHVYNASHVQDARGPTSKAAAGLDSSILFILATTGATGLTMYAWMIIAWVKHKRTPITIAILIALLIHSLFTNSLFYPWIMIWFWIFAGAMEFTSDT